jgi:UDP-N-acetyl-D-glucosamine dehydrogenase
VIDLKEKILGEIRLKEVVIGIVGLGYVGLPLVMHVETGVHAIGFDIDATKNAILSCGERATYTRQIQAAL